MWYTPSVCLLALASILAVRCAPTAKLTPSQVMEQDFKVWQAKCIEGGGKVEDDSLHHSVCGYGKP